MSVFENKASCLCVSTSTSNIGIKDKMEDVFVLKNHDLAVI